MNNNIFELWPEKIVDISFEAVLQIFMDRVGLYLQTLTPSSSPFQEPHKTQLINIFSAYGWLLRWRMDGNISAKEIMEIILTPATIQSVYNSLDKKITEFCSQSFFPKNALQGWKYIEERFFLGTALDGLWIIDNFNLLPEKFSTENLLA